MANLSQFLAPTQGPRAVAQNGPGSNGFWQRKAWLTAGSYRFVVKKTGRHRIVGIGAGAGGRGQTSGAVNAGSGGGLAIAEVDLVKGDVVLVTVGVGSEGAGVGGTPADGGTTTITCAARGINIVIPGGRFATANVRPTGANLVNNIGGNAPATSGTAYCGGASSGTPLSDGFPSSRRGGAGWGGSPDSDAGSGSTGTGPSALDELTGILRSATALLPFWDIEDIFGSASFISSQEAGGGHGAGGSASNNYPRVPSTRGPGIGGGGGAPTTSGGNSYHGGPGGNGGGGGQGDAHGSTFGGRGGDGLVLIHWDEVF